MFFGKLLLNGVWTISMECSGGAKIVLFKLLIFQLTEIIVFLLVITLFGGLLCLPCGQWIPVALWDSLLFLVLFFFSFFRINMSCVYVYYHSLYPSVIFVSRPLFADNILNVCWWKILPNLAGFRFVCGIRQPGAGWSHSTIVPDFYMLDSWCWIQFNSSAQFCGLCGTFTY